MNVTALWPVTLASCRPKKAAVQVQEIIDLGKDMQIVIVSDRDPLLRGSVQEWG